MSKLRCSESREAKFANEKVKDDKIWTLIIMLNLILGNLKLDVAAGLTQFGIGIKLRPVCSSKMSHLNEWRSNISTAGNTFFPIVCLPHLTAQMGMTFSRISSQHLFFALRDISNCSAKICLITLGLKIKKFYIYCDVYRVFLMGQIHEMSGLGLIFWFCWLLVRLTVYAKVYICRKQEYRSSGHPCQWTMLKVLTTPPDCWNRAFPEECQQNITAIPFLGKTGFRRNQTVFSLPDGHNGT